MEPADNEEVIDPEVQLPYGLRPITLTPDEAATVRKLLNDPTEPTFAGKDLPKGNLAAILKGRTLTEEEAEGIRRLLDDPNEPKHAGQEMPTADASALRRIVPEHPGLNKPNHFEA